jgi:hypothetical protein
MYRARLKPPTGGPFEMDPDELGYECRELINIIAAEFESDPMSVQCFDLRIVERAKKAARIHRRYESSSLI